MKRITAIIGSPKPSGESVTCKLTEMFIEALKNNNDGITAEVICLSQRNIAPCRGKSILNYQKQANRRLCCV
jgi:multimeric flavodoxin WrbA